MEVKGENKTGEYKNVLSFSYEDSDKNYGKGKSVSIHMTVRGDDFEETYDRLITTVRPKMKELLVKPDPNAICSNCFKPLTQCACGKKQKLI